MSREVVHKLQTEDGVFEVWRREDGDKWFGTWLPDDPEAGGYPGFTYEPGKIGVENEPEALLKWGREKFGAGGMGSE